MPAKTEYTSTMIDLTGANPRVHVIRHQKIAGKWTVVSKSIKKSKKNQSNNSKNTNPTRRPGRKDLAAAAGEPLRMAVVYREEQQIY